MAYDFKAIETKWQKRWEKDQTFRAKQPQEFEGDPKPPFYVLDMFPYPSGAGLHVGHPLGYIASDIYARYKRHKGFNVLHPQGYDSFGLPAEQYAIQTGQHPSATTEINIEGCLDNKGKILDKYVEDNGKIKNSALIDKSKETSVDEENYQSNVIKGYRKQLDKIGFSFDWSREVRTSNPDYYKWTQWIFIQLFESWYDAKAQKSKSIPELVNIFEKEGNTNVDAVADDNTTSFSASEWSAFTDDQKEELLLNYRLTYLAETEVNWCPALGTVLANDEIVKGASERGGHPVSRKKMKQWSMRISAFADRLLSGLEDLDWSESLKETQRNWIGKSVGAQLEFPILSFPKGEENTKPGYMTGGNNAHTLIEKAKENRNQPTVAEKTLWIQLRAKKLSGYKFRQQHLIGDYIADFVCLSKSLVVEVDGGYHNETKAYDEERTQFLNKKGFKVIRFKNEEVIGNIDEVLDQIKTKLDQLPSYDKMAKPSEESKVKPLSLGEGQGERIETFTTRPDTIYGVSFITLAPEHDLVSKITTPEQKEEIDAYVKASAKRSERERMADVKSISGAFTGAYAEHPLTKEPLPVWVGDYVLAGYGTGAVMSVPCGDQRDHDFAKHFGIPIPNVFEGIDISKEAYTDKSNATKIANSDFLNGLGVLEAIPKAIEALANMGQGAKKINYRLRDAVFSRQRYWGEPFPVYYINGLPKMIESKYLPLELPEVEKYLPTEDGAPPLGRAHEWAWDTEQHQVVSNTEIDHKTVFPLELNTMPGWAGSSWYLFHYMETENRDQHIASKENLDYWNNVDLYIGGSEHATGHLLYSRFWTKFLNDKGVLPVDEPFKKLINQGMILGESAIIEGFWLRINFNENINFEKSIALEKPRPVFLAISKEVNNQIESGESNGLLDRIIQKILNKKKLLFNYNEQNGAWKCNHEPARSYVDVSLVNTSNELDIEGLKNWRSEFSEAEFILKNGELYDPISSPSGRSGGDSFVVAREVEKMSKSKFNVVNPDDICEDFGADSLRLYEMFLGPLEQAKPWSTAGLSGVHNFLKKLWKLYFTSNSLQEGRQDFVVSDEPASKESLKILHKTIKKVTQDIEELSFNTSVSTFMICVNELTQQSCKSREVLEPLAVLISPYAPHIAEELWELLGNTTSISEVDYPVFKEHYLKEDSKTYPISFNGKMRFTLDLSLDLSKDEIEKIVMAEERTQKQLEGRTPKKVIIVPGKIVNIVG
jgi:leucyl-tRNA synthetase